MHVISSHVMLQACSCSCFYIKAVAALLQHAAVSPPRTQPAAQQAPALISHHRTTHCAQYCGHYPRAPASIPGLRSSTIYWCWMLACMRMSRQPGMLEPRPSSRMCMYCPQPQHPPWDLMPAGSVVNLPGLTCIHIHVSCMS